MNHKQLLVGLTILLAVIIVYFGCSKRGDPIVVVGDMVVNVKYLSTPPNVNGDIIIDSAWEKAEEASIRVGEDTVFTNQFSLRIVGVRAISDSQNLYMRFNWVDSSKSDKPGFWRYDTTSGSGCRAWTHNAVASHGDCTEIDNQLLPRWDNEDALAMFIDFGNNLSDKANCRAACHDSANSIGSRHYTAILAGNIDGWVWRAGRTEPMGLAEDQFWGPQQKDDSHTDTLYRRNALADGGTPRWMHVGGAASTRRISTLLTSDTVVLDQSAAQGWAVDDSIPGYVLDPNWNTGNTSSYDVKAKALYDASTSRWTLVLWRKLKTSYTTEDVDFTDGRKEYQATLAIMDHTNQRHSGSKPFMIKF